MRSNLLIRLLGLSLAVAVFSIAATAWLTTRGTSELLRGEFEETLEADNFIYQALLRYAESHSSWDDVNATLGRLADRTGARIALTAPDGTVIADTNAGGGGSPPLPQTPVIRIDASSPHGAMLAEQPLFVDDAGITAAPGTTVMAEAELSTAYASAVPHPSWRMTDVELAERKRLVADATSCLRDELDRDVDVFLTPGGALTMSADGESQIVMPGGAEETGGVAVPDGAGAAERTESEPILESSCIPPELTEPTEAAREVNEKEVEFVTACLTQADVSYAIATDPSGMRTVVPKNGAPTRAWDTCAFDARAKALEPFVADPALLYTGSSDRFDAFSGDGWWRTLLTGLAVLAVAAGVTVLAGRRLTRPIRALTAAVRRMGRGDRSSRVPVSGHDEVAQLGQAFNTMAESIAKSEDQRRAMVSDIAHELRTPLANVRGYLEAAEDGVVPLDDALVSSLLEESALLQHLIDDLQDLALADAGALRVHRETCDAADLARQAVAAHRTSASDAGVTLVAEAPEAVQVDVDPKRIRQALSNLLANAVHHTPAGGVVRVTAGLDGEVAALTVSDDGPGIAAEQLPRLFDRFYRTDTSRSRATGGSGLGLAITKHLVEAHEGTVEVRSTEGVGSVFTIRLPVRAPVPAAD